MQPVEGPVARMTALASITGPDHGLTAAQYAVILREAVQDKSYQASPLGTMVARYLRWMRNEYGATRSTLRDYEAILARMSKMLADRQLHEVSIDDLRLVIDSWEARTARTRQKVTSVIRAFWSWAEEQGHIALSPAARIRRPRAEHKVARVLPLDAHGRLLTATPEPRDRLGLFCLLELGLRRSELAGIQFRDFDADRGWLRVYGKGQKERVLPLRGPILAELRLALASDLPHLGRPPAGDDFLLYPIRRYADGKGTEGQLRAAYRAFPKTRPSVQAVHRWWYRHAQAAGLVGPGVTSGLNMHRARHTFAMELRRVAGIDAASHALGHSNLSTTLGIYGHRDNSDLERAMDAYAAWRQNEQSVPPETP
jgi:integrase/recombinase XerC